MNKIIIFIAAALCCFCAQTAEAQTCNAPVVNSFSPNTGFIGSTVTITGANFDAIPANNQVYFGATRATVVTASFGVLTVTVPLGANTAPIAVKNGCNKIGYSSTAFNGIFCPTPITSTTYQNVAFNLGGVYGAYNMLAQDMDLDGKPDVISAQGSGVTIARNLSTPGNLSFVAHNFGGGGSSVAVADFDGDGKRDILLPGVVKRNVSSGPGNINLVHHNVPSGGYQTAAGDFNNDGKIDIVWEGGGWIYINRNTSTGPGVISFANATNLQYVGPTCTGIQVADVDGDGKTDILATQGNGNRAVTLRNITTDGSLTFTLEAPEFWSSNGQYPYRCMIADFDKDGKIDLVTPNFNGATNTAIYRNTSVVGNISFATTVNQIAPGGNYRVGVGDVNGDGFPDIVTKSLSVNVFSVYPNVSSGPGNVAFSTRFDYTSSAMAEVSGIVIGDLDGDFVPDIATSGWNSNAIRFHRNTSAQVDNTPPTALCKNITVALSPSGTVTVTPQMIDNGSGDACGIGALHINNQSSITFSCNDIGVNNVTLKVTDKAGNVTTCTATVTVAAAAVVVAGQTTVCQGQTVPMTANAGDSYQWQNNGVDIAGATSQGYTATQSGNYSVTVTNAGGCSGTSSAVSITVNNNPTVSISPSGSLSLCPPSNTLTLSASTSSIYQWKQNSLNIAGANQQTLNVNMPGHYSVQVIDLFGCSATSSEVYVAPTDNIAPTAICKNVTVALDQNESASITVADINNGSFDNCGAVTVSLTGQTSFNCSDVGNTITVTLHVTDASGNTSSCTAAVTVTDPQSYCNIAPVAVCQPVTISASANCNATVTATAFDGGSTDADGDMMTFTISPAGPYPVGTTNVTLTVTDPTGASSSCTTTVTVVDDTAPVVSCPSPITVNNDAGTCGAYVTVPAPVISDNCNVVCNTEGLDEYSVGPVTGKSPQWTLWPLPGMISAEVTSERFLSAPNSLKVTGHPNGGPVDQVFKLGNQTSGNWILSFNMYIPLGKTGYYNLQHTESLNSWAHQVKFNSNGIGVLNTAGTNNNFNYPQDQWFEVKQVINQTTDQTSLYVNGVHVRTWQFSRHTSGTAVNNQLGALNFYPVSNTNFIGAPEPNKTAEPLAYIDNITLCGNAAQIGTYVSRRYSKVYPVGTTPAKIIISDLRGNSVTCSGTSVTVVDAEKPTITAPGAVSVNADNGSCAATGVVLGTPVTADNCGVASVTNDAPASFPVGSTMVTWTVTDIHGNVSSAIQAVSVTDDQNPILTCTTDIFYCYSGTQYTVGALGATDNCGIASVTYDVTGATARSGSGNNASGTYNVGTSTITWTVTDVNGNTSSCSSTVTINPPISVTIPDASAYSAGVQPNTVYVGYGPAQSVTYSAQPTGGTAPYTYSWSTGATSQSITVSPISVGVHNYTVTITDSKGCTATFTKSVTVADVRCGNKNDKVLVCHKTGSASNPYVQICIAPGAVATHLANGSYLGACTNNAVTRTGRPVAEAAAKVIMAYPNPSQGNFNLQLKGFANGKVTVQVLNALGKVVLTKEVNVGYVLQDETLDLKGVASGLYQVRVVSSDAVTTTGVIITR